MTTNEITVYERMQNPTAAIELMGKAIAQSKLFGCQNEAQGQVLALECMATRTPPLSKAKRFDLMNGKLSMKSQTMLADFRTIAGGKTKMVERSADRAAIWMQDREGNKYEFELTWSEAQEEVFPYAGKEGDIVKDLEGDRSKLKLKPKYARPRSRAIMLWNRLISDSVRTIAPEINCGQYTPEEIEDFTDSPGNVVAADPDPVVEPAAALIEAMESGEVLGEAVDATFEIVDGSPKEASDTNKLTEAEFNSLPVNGLTVDAIKDTIKQAHQLGLTETSGKVKEKLIESGVGKLANLTQTDADRLQSALERKLLGEWLSSPLAPVKNESPAS